MVSGKSNRFAVSAYAALIALAAAAGALNFVRHVKLTRAEIEHTFHSRSELLSKFVSLHRDQVAVMRNLVLESYQSANRPAADPQEPTRLEFREVPDHTVWESVPSQAQGGLTGRGGLPPGADVRREIAAARGMDAQIRATLQFDPEVVWLYYLSARDFIYLAPHVPVEQFHFDPRLYQRDYWREATPAANPSRRMILSGPHQDLAGKGWIMTFACPVYDGDIFLGITALDLCIDTLHSLASLGKARGKSMIISENGQMVAKQGGFKPEVVTHPPLSHTMIDWREDKDGALWLSSPVLKDELWLVHRVTRRELYRAAAREALAAWFMIVLMVLLGFVLHRLCRVVAEITRLTHIDPLTQTLNRRGFHERAEELIGHTRRHELAMAIFLMDIDFFKKVNDNYGHAEGDHVLKQVGDYLLQTRRPLDLVCRWGGEEFLMAIPLERADDASGVAERVRREAQRTRIQPGDVAITLSGGLVLLRPDEPIDAAIDRADALLYQAKHDGRNRILADLRP